MVARVFFVWVSVFNLFAVAVFWSFMADLFNAEQGKRLFGFIGAGGTAGALLGPVITIGLSVPLGPVNLLIAAMILLEAAVFCVYRLERAATRRRRRQPNRNGSAAAPSPRCLSSFGRLICSASPPGSVCCRFARRSFISNRSTSFRPRCMAPARRPEFLPASIWR